MPACTEQVSAGDAMTTSSRTRHNLIDVHRLVYDAQIRAALDRLAAFSSPDQIASYFKAEGITGFTSDSAQCPVARWVTKQVTLPENCEFSIGLTFGLVSRNREPGIREPMWKFPLPGGVARFVRRFDNRIYPQLIRRHTDA